MSLRLRALRVHGLALLTLMTLGCAGAMHGTTLERESRRDRYLALLSRREAAASALDAEASLWLTVRSAAPIPGVLADLALGAPDAFRLRVHSPLGTVLDFGGRGGGLIAALPSKRAYLQQAAAGESLGMRSAAGMVVRVCTASWRPTERAWQDATRLGTNEMLRWEEDGDSIRVAVDSEGLPAEIEWQRAERGAIRIRYLDWSRGNPSWPSHFEVADVAGEAHLTCRLERVRARSLADSGRLQVPVPSGAARLEWADAVRAVTQAVAP